MTPVYVVSAYRWGLRDCHSYVVGVKLDKTEAIALADAHVEYRGGKYGCEVMECDPAWKSEDGSGGGTTSVYYKESPYFGRAGHGGMSNPVDTSKPCWVYDTDSDKKGEAPK